MVSGPGRGPTQGRSRLRHEVFMRTSGSAASSITAAMEPPTLHPDPRRARRRGNRGHSRPILGRGASEGVRGKARSLTGHLGDWPEHPATHLVCPSRQSHLGWQPSRFLADRAEAERAFALAEQLGSVNAAATQLGTTWPSLRKAFTRHGLGMPARNPEAVRQRAIAARLRGGQPATPGLGPGVCCPQSGRPPGPRAARSRAVPVGPPRGAGRHPGRQHGGRAVQRESRPPAHHRAWAIIRRADRAHRLAGQRASRSNRADRTSRSHQPQEREMVADAR